MTVAELIEILSDMPQDAEVRIATQPSWPLAAHVGSVVSPDELTGEIECDNHGYYSCDECTPSIVWLAEGGQPDDSPYAPRAVFG